MRSEQIDGLSVWLGLKSLWSETRGDSRVTVAILDGPVDQSHSCFQGAKLRPVDSLVSAAADNGPASRHGTHVTSIVFGQRDGPIRGIAPACRSLIVPIFTNGPQASIAPCSQLDLARAITQAVENGAQIINISGGQLDAGGEPHEILAKAVQACADKGALIVASAGNEGCNCLHVPAARCRRSWRSVPWTQTDLRWIRATGAHPTVATESLLLV